MVNKRILEPAIFIGAIIISIFFIPILFGFLSSSSVDEKKLKFTYLKKIKWKKYH